MRLIVLYDLPTTEITEVNEYTKFRKWLIKRGYIMMQYSVYTKCINTSSKYKREFNAIENNIPSAGHIRLIAVTETQYDNMKILIGGKRMNEKINNSERIVKI